ncbi:zinc-binding dehydrogenase [Sorangium sp. So ce296]|uniref:zinc-binding dehydrogenase n=1 Tax=Sorangium sp. So ce296 TaxID=3133296 RepID=UPI003F5EA425
MLVQGGAGAVGCCAVGLARQAGARVIATVRSEADAAVAARAGAHEVIRTDGLSTEEVVDQIRALAPDGVSHVVEVAFDANIGVDEKLLKVGGSLATYATGNGTPAIPFWQLLFKNIHVFFLGSDDFQPETKAAAADALNEMLRAGWPGFSIDRRVPLAEIADAHEHLETRRGSGRVIVTM